MFDQDYFNNLAADTHNLHKIMIFHHCTFMGSGGVDDISSSHSITADMLEHYLMNCIELVKLRGLHREAA